MIFFPTTSIPGQCKFIGKKGEDDPVHTTKEYTWGSDVQLRSFLNPIRHLLALVGARHIVHVSRVSVKG